MAAPDPHDTVGPDDALEPFHPLVQAWFREEVGTPTEAQALAWPRIAGGEHVLVSAPTGSGKTLTAFLWALDRLLTGAWPGDRLRVLYISPLRALNTDVRRNLQKPLGALKRRFADAGTPAARVQVMTRSGDTPQSERRKMLRHPPEILVTTPESLNILLTSRSGRNLLGDVRCVILDEIHALAASKRGTHMLTAVERLAGLSGEFQRIALSATVRPMELVAEMVGGYERLDVDGEARYAARPVSIVRSKASKVYDVGVRFPVERDPESELDDDSMWRMLTRDFRKVIERNRSTLLFANSRRMTEKATRLINMEASSELAYSHHGSLSREVRSVVEKRLKDGELRAIVATNSLELGIDIGELDQVLLIQTPRSVASAVQRVGRAGHGVGQVSRGVFYPTHGRDLLEAAVVARAVAEQDIEELRPVRQPLDVLAQVVLSMCVGEARGIDELYDRIRSSWPYRHLLRRHYDRVLDMLAGRFAETRVRELKARVHLDRVRGTVKARPGVERLLYMAGGTIADRGYFALRHRDTMAKIGELDEEFVWERSVGDSFTLGTQSWRIERITHNDVLVAPGRGPAGIAPFWRADAQDRGYDFCQKVGAFLERAESRLKDAPFKDALRTDWLLGETAAEELLSYLSEQREATGGHLPRRDRLLVEHTGDRMGKSGSRQVILHTMWGGSVNRPFGMALAAAWEEKYPDPL
ncbi:MAG: DEAD/DEAH box helicase, partial [Acidobacteriota bacterium]